MRTIDGAERLPRCVTSAPGLEARFILHAVTISYVVQQQPDLRADAVVRQLVRRALDLAVRLGCRSIAFPVLATGAARLALQDSVSQMLEGMVAFLDASPVPLCVEVFVYDAGNWPWQTPKLPVFEEALSTRDGYVLRPEGDATRLRWLGDDSVEIDPRPRDPSDHSLTLDDEGRRRAIVRALRELDARRAALEVKHIAMCVNAGESGASGLASIAQDLDRLRERRANFERRLADLAVGRDAHVDARSVFVSSTYVDLKAFRSGVRDEVNGLGYTFIGMEDFLASPDMPRVVMLDHLARAQRYVGILGWRYGSRDVPTGWSYTQLEYETAVSWGIPIHMFIASNRVPINGGALDPDDGVARLHEFRAKVKQRHLIVEFDDVATLRARVRDSLMKYGGRD